MLVVIIGFVLILQILLNIDACIIVLMVLSGIRTILFVFHGVKIIDHVHGYKW